MTSMQCCTEEQRNSGVTKNGYQIDLETECSYFRLQGVMKLVEVAFVGWFSELNLTL